VPDDKSQSPELWPPEDFNGCIDIADGLKEDKA